MTIDVLYNVVMIPLARWHKLCVVTQSF